MDFDPKTSKLRNQEDNKYLASYGFFLNPRIKIKFCPHGVGISLAPPNAGVYMHPQVLARLLITSFVHSILTFYQVALSQFSAVAWIRTPLRRVSVRPSALRMH